MLSTEIGPLITFIFNCIVEMTWNTQVCLFLLSGPNALSIACQATRRCPTRTRRWLLKWCCRQTSSNSWRHNLSSRNPSLPGSSWQSQPSPTPPCFPRAQAQRSSQAPWSGVWCPDPCHFSTSRTLSTSFCKQPKVWMTSINCQVSQKLSKLGQEL